MLAVSFHRIRLPQHLFQQLLLIGYLMKVVCVVPDATQSTHTRHLGVTKAMMVLTQRTKTTCKSLMICRKMPMAMSMRPSYGMNIGLLVVVGDHTLVACHDDIVSKAKAKEKEAKARVHKEKARVNGYLGEVGGHLPLKMVTKHCAQLVTIPGIPIKHS